MPSLKVITPILGGSYYHIYNRGINRQIIFFNDNNYRYFLRLMDQFITPYVSVLAYALIQNHFHLVIKVNNFLKTDSIEISDDGEIGKIVSNLLVVTGICRSFYPHTVRMRFREFLR